jgi:glycosyltransferase involved in cell wall biosynthesis
LTAHTVIAVSRFCADHGISQLALDPQRIHVVYHGVSERFRVRAPCAPAEPPYFLFVGEYSPTKGHAEAYEVIGRLADRGAPHSLKVVGRIVPWTEDPMRAAVAKSRRPDRIELLGYQQDGLADLYRRASGLLITSRYESFALPAIEAMASGIPVVAFDNSALPEIIAHGGAMVTDGDVEAMADVLWQIVTNATLDQELRRRAIDRAGAFSWGRTAEEHAAIYRDAGRR